MTSDETECPHCHAKKLEGRLEPSLKAVSGRRYPVLEHHTECPVCGAKRVATVRLDTVTGQRSGRWTNVPGQGSLRDD